MPKLKYEKLSIHQQRAILTNSCLRNFAALRKALHQAGYYADEHVIKAVEDDFRSTLEKKA